MAGASTGPSGKRKDLPGKDVVGRLSDLSEDAIHRFSGAPGADRLLGALNVTRERLDELQRRLRGVDELEKRVAVLERKVDKLSKAGAATAPRRAAKTKTKPTTKSVS
ncbi:MAG TPA: hypothetical protein VMT74_11155 [Gaiellaceae bacterium]|nr:hypothetical protein [Gaiellaceae bacterium]